MKSQLLSIMFIDVEGYTSRAANQTREENEKFIEEMHNFINQNVEKWAGKVVKSMGDGFLCIFQSPTNAVQCGIEIQRKVHSRNANILDPQNIIRLRIGINTGEVAVNESNGDIFGDAVNVAARIENFAEPNDVFISEATYLAMNRNEVNAIDLGPQKLKGVTREVRIYKVCRDAIGKVGLKKSVSSNSIGNLSLLKSILKITWIRGLLLIFIFILGFIGGMFIMKSSVKFTKPADVKPENSINLTRKENWQDERDLTFLNSEQLTSNEVKNILPTDFKGVSPRFAEQFKIAVQAFKNGELQKAVEVLDSSLPEYLEQTNRPSIFALLTAGYIYGKAGHIEKSNNAFNIALHINSKRIRPNVELESIVTKIKNRIASSSD